MQFILDSRLDKLSQLEVNMVMDCRKGYYEWQAFFIVLIKRFAVPNW